MDITTIETVVETTDVEQPKKSKREKPVPGRKKGGRAKNLLKKRVLYNQGMLYNIIMRNAMFLFCVVIVGGKQQKLNYIDM